MLRKLKHMLPFNLRKSIVQSLVLSKLYYNDVVYHKLPEYLEKRLQRVQKAAASFALGKHATTSDVLLLRWLPIKEQRELSLLKLVHKGIYNLHWPKYFKIDIHQPERYLRSSDILRLPVPIENSTFQGSTATLLTDYRKFKEINRSYKYRDVIGGLYSYIHLHIP